MLTLFEEKRYRELRAALEEMNSVDIATFIESLENDPRIVLLFRMLPKDEAADVFAYLTSDAQETIVNGITDRELHGLISDSFLDDTVDFLEEMPAMIVKRVLHTTDHETRQQINQLLMYPDASAGSLMTIEYMKLDSSWTVARAISQVRRKSTDLETISTLFITDLARHLVGMLELRDLLAADDDEIIGEIMETDFLAANTHEAQESVADTFKKYDFESMPVVDNEGRLVGIITIDDIVDVIEEETTEDIYKMAAMEPIENRYMDTGIFELAKKRIVWLAVLMISATLTGLIIQKFQSALAANVLLTSFIPMLMDTGGNAGSQSSVSVIRATVLGEIGFEDATKVIWKEFRVSIVTGLGIFLLNFARVILMYQDWTIAWIVSLTLFCTILAAKFVGGTLPLIATKLKLDPALMASPTITTIVDAVTLLLYFNIAALLLPNL